MDKFWKSPGFTLVVLLTISFLSAFTVLAVSPKSFSVHLSYIILGFIIYFVVRKINPEYFRFFAAFFYVGSILLLASTLIFGILVKGSIRWIEFGSIRFQPSEVVKPFIIIFFANNFARAKNSWLWFLKQIGLFFLVFILIFKQPDLGNAVVFFFIFFLILFFSRFPLKRTIIVVLLVIFLAPVGFWSLKSYQKARLTSFLNPQGDPQGTAYHQIQSKIAVGSGGLKGRGIGLGKQTRLKFLPEKETDFIFASFAEQFGFFGCLLLVSCYLFLFMKILFLMSVVRDNFSLLLLVGVFAYLSSQTFIHIGMNLAILPVTGLTLPLVSTGGSSVISVFFTLGQVAFFERNLV